MKQGEFNFLQKLKDKKSQVIQQELTHFITIEFPTYVGTLEKLDISNKVQEFVTKMVIEFSRTWKLDLQNNEKIYKDICDGFESIVTKSLYNKIFCSTRKEKEDDYNFEKLVQKFEFITPKHLDIDESGIDDIYIEVAINKLSMINQFKTPKDKAIILINFCNILSSMITDQPKKTKKKIAGADEVFPLVVYAILKGKIRKLKSNLGYIQLFRHSTRLESTEEYYFITINSALEFIENMCLKTLNIDPNEYEDLVRKAEERELERLKIIVTPTKRNADENYLLYHLTENNLENNNTLSNSNSPNNYIELTDFKRNVLINTSSVISKSLLPNENGLLNVDLDKLYKEYFSIDFNEFSIHKLEKLVNDFKIVLKLADSFKQNYYKGNVKISENPKVKKKGKSPQENINLIDI